jgi:hypothetical protein
MQNLGVSDKIIQVGRLYHTHFHLFLASLFCRNLAFNMALSFGRKKEGYKL